MKLVNTIFDSQLIELISITLLYLVMTLYYMYASIHGEQIDLSTILKILAMGLSLTICNSTKLVMTCSICEQATREAKKTKSIVHSISLDEFDNEMRDEILQFSLQISLNQLASSKTNILRLNYDLLRQCLAFVVTYGIFMIQWENTLEMEDEYAIQNETNLKE
ncbi:uncharacterized protein LOC143149672 [Ptiloglossa arizonensis]|uniref:uncharacterized protein LOC143149672 n=1 Tax=Ptiloglossa arizonensis TaxID=3350558 RepID=UPI003F9F6FF1